MNILRLGIAAALLVAMPIDTAEAGCSISTTPLNFGLYDPLGGSPNDSTATVTYRCAPQDRNITIMLSTGASGTFNSRKLFDGSEALNYNLYRDASRNVTWGDGSGGTSFYFNADPPNFTNVNLTIYARVPAAQDISAGVYSDNVSIIINF